MWEQAARRLPKGVTGRSAGGPDHLHTQERSMGKYFIGWLLGVPVFVLVILYFLFH